MSDDLYPHLRSMTGQGRSEVSGEAGTLVVELRSVNNRGLKLIVRSNEALAAHEGDITAALRGQIDRGTVTVHATLQPPPGQDLPRLNQPAIAAYAEQLAGAVGHLGVSVRLDLSGLLALPGVLVPPETGSTSDDEIAEQRGSLIAKGVASAVERFNHMRHYEAVAMARSLENDLETVRTRVKLVESLAPTVIERYQERLLEKIRKMLAEHHLPTEPVDIIREVQLFADRSDVSEELTRLSSHLELFSNVLAGTHVADQKNRIKTSVKASDSEQTTEAIGRKLDFVIQEMFRETNTIGSKAGNAAVAEHIVEIKCAIERMRELVQNLE